MTSDYMPHTRSTQQQPVTAQVDLSFDEVANLFPYPIAEAASTLGVSTNDLKRVCRENGLNRWPYRKILAGKTVEDIKKEAAREMVILERMARMQPQSTSNAVRSNRSGAFNFRTSIPTGERAAFDSMKRQPVGPSHGFYAHASSLRPLHIDQRPHLHNQFHLRVNIPTYLDEFRHGFPSKGLSSLSTHWWGSTLSDKKEDKHVDKVREDIEMKISSGELGETNEHATEQQGGNCSNDSARKEKGAEKDREDLMPASMLTRTRKNAVVSGRKALGIAVTRGYGAYRLGDKDEALLRAIFADSFPSLWGASLGN